MKVWLTTTAYRETRWLEPAERLLALGRETLERSEDRRFTLAPSADVADLVVYVEPEYTKMREWFELYFSEELPRRYPNRCFVVDSADTCWGVVPGVFTHLRASQVDRARLRSGAFLRMYNGLVEDAWRARSSAPPRLLYSFRGASSSAPVRREIVATLRPSARAAIVDVKSWFNHGDDEKRAYLAEIRDSAFVLCPRGVGPATYRLFETMQLGRVPVVLADEWVEPFGAPWTDFTLRVHESRVAEIPEIVARHEPYAAEMGARARRAWEEWFAPDVVFRRTLEAIEAILLDRPAGHDERDYQDWRSLRTQWKLGWTMPQKVAHAVRSGQALERVKRRIGR